MAENGQYKFSIRLDNKQLEMDLAQAKKAFADLVKQAKNAGAQVGDTPNPFEQFGKSVPEATRQFNGLNTATQQLVRELPAASMGFNTFFLAVSNNLPIFADQVKRVNEENKNLAAQGKPTTSVLKQIGKSLLSWQTGLVLGVTVLSMYGKEIVNWVASLFKGKKAIEASAEATKNLNKAIEEGGLGIGDEIYKLKELQRAWINLGDSLDARKRFIEDNKSAFDKLGVSVQNVADADRLFIEQTDAYISALKARAQAAAAQKLAEAEFEKVIKKQIEKEELEKSISEMPDKVVSSYTPIYSRTRYGVQTTGYKTNYVTNTDKVEAQEELEALNNSLKETTAYADSLFNMSTEFSAEAERLLKEAGLKESDNNDDYNNDAERIAREREQTQREIADKTASLASDAQRAATDAVIQAMEEGLEKEKTQINADYDAKEQAITKREEELKKLQGGKLTDAQTTDFASLRASNEAMRTKAITEAEEKAAERLNKALNDSIKDMADYYIQYGTLKEKILYTTKKYATLIDEAQNEGERMALGAERDAILAEYQMEASSWAQELVGKTTTQLNKMLAELQAEVEAKQEAFDALGASDSEEAQKYREEINWLNAQIKALQKELGKAGRSAGDKNWNESVQTFQNIANSAMEAADGIAEFDEDLGNTLRSIAQLASTGLNLVVVIKKITDAAWTGATAITAMEKASLILAAISAGIQVVSTLFNLFRQSDEVEETKRQFKELNDELERLHKLARIDSVEGTIFGPNPFGNFINNLKAMQDALKDFEASKQAIREKDAQYIDSIVGWNPDGTAQTIKIAQGSQNLNDAIANMRVKTKDRNWLGELFNGGDEYADLGDLYPDLFDEFGDVTLEGLQNLQNSDVWEKLGEKDRELIEQMIADWEDYNAAVEATEKYLSDIFGDMGNELSDALVDAFENGTDAAIAFGDVVNNVMKRLASDIVNTTLFDPILKDAEDKALALNNQLKAGEITYEEYLAALNELMTDTTNQLLDLKDEAADTYEAAGIKQGSGSTQATSKGFQTMSQETGSELNGRFTDIQGQTHRIAEAVEFNKGMQQQQVFFLQSISETLAAIHTNTDSIEKHTQALVDIKGDINAIRRTMDNGGGL